MRILVKFLVFCTCFFFLGNLFSQSAPQALAAGQDPNVLYRNESTGSIFAHTRGFGVNYRRLWHVTGKLKSLIEIEGLNMRHPKELRVKPDGGKSYYYGKLNSLLFIRAGYGFQRTLYERAERRSIEIRMVTLLGPSICFAKPIYVQVAYPDSVATPTGNGYIIKDERYDPTRDNQDNILGRAPIYKGLGEIKIYPGAFAKLGFSFEYGKTRTSISAIETGVVVDYMPNAVPTMAYNKAENFFVTLYLGFHFGKRWF